MTSNPAPYVAARIAAQQRLAKRGTCPRCGVEVLCGLDRDDVAYWVVACPRMTRSLGRVVSSCGGGSRGITRSTAGRCMCSMCAGGLSSEGL